MPDDDPSHGPAYVTRPTSFSARTAKASSLPVAPPLTVPQSLMCGAVARAVQIFTFFPIDTVKTRIQSARKVPSAVSTKSPSTFSSLNSALSQGRLFSGVGVTLAGQVPYAMLTFGLYETINTHLSNPTFHIPNWLRIVLAASIGDAMGSLWLTPSEVVKSKTQAGIYPTPVSTIRSLAATGPLSFYQGYIAALARDVPFRAIQMLLYDHCRRIYTRYFKSSHNSGFPGITSETVELTPLENLLVGAISGTITAVATTPLDVIRTRMMSQPPGANALYRNALDCVAKTISAEGPQALLLGIGPRALLLGPATAVFFVTYEACKSFFRSRSSLPSLASSRSSAICSLRPRSLYS